MLRFAVVGILILGVLGCSKQPKRSFFLSSTVPEQQQRILQQMMAQVQALPSLDTSTEPSLMMGMNDLSGPSLNQFLLQHISYVVGESFNTDGDGPNFTTENGVYNAGPLSQASVREPDYMTGATVMSNIGGFRYITGKPQSLIYTAKIDDDRIKIVSPFVGIMKIGKGLFTPWVKGSPVDSIPHLLIYITVNAHESMHNHGNDFGNVKNAAFAHQKCPASHPSFANIEQCDASRNGPYGVGAYLLQKFIAYCPGCSSSDRYSMTETLDDYKSRIMNNTLYLDPTPEAIR